MHQHDVGERLGAEIDVGDIAQGDGRAADVLERQGVEAGDRGRRGVGLDQVVEPADLLVAGGQHDILVGRHVEQLGAGHTGAGDLQRQHRHRGSVVDQHLRRRGAGRHLLQHGLRDRADLGLGDADIGARLEEDLDDAAAVEGLALDVLDIVDGRGERALIVVDDAAGHVLRREAGIGPDDSDDGDADVGEDVGGRAPDGQAAEQQDQDRQDGEGVGPLQRDQDDGVHGTA